MPHNSKCCSECHLHDQFTLNDFLVGVERKAFRMAVMAIGNHDDALDIVQDSMLVFVSRYNKRPINEWTPLFYRVLQSRITDSHRRALVRNRFRVWFNWNGSEDSREDPLEQLPDSASAQPDNIIECSQTTAVLKRALKDLPLRQQQAFLLRYWEGLDTRETAIAMSCSQGSVKTHLSRAIHALRGCLEGNKHER